jgi:hypothetical protein
VIPPSFKRVIGSLAIVTAVVAGCGGAGEREFHVEAPTSVSTGPVTKAQFVDHANRICRRAWPRILKFYIPFSRRRQDKGLSNEEVFARSVRVSFLATLDFVVFDPIHRTPAPAGENAHVEEVIGKLQRAIELGQRRIRIHSLGQFASVFEAYNLAAHEYGLDDCLVDGTRLLAAQP